MSASDYDFVLALNIRIKKITGSGTIATGIPPEIGIYMVRKGKWQKDLVDEKSFANLHDCEKLMKDRGISEEEWA